VHVHERRNSHKALWLTPDVAWGCEARHISMLAEVLVSPTAWVRMLRETLRIAIGGDGGAAVPGAITCTGGKRRIHSRTGG